MEEIKKTTLDSSTYINGKTISKINMDGTIYNIGKNRNTVGYNECIGINADYPSIALSIGSDPQTGVGLNGQRYTSIKVVDGMYDGTSYIGVKSDDVNLISSNIRSGVNIFGVDGDFTSDGNLQASAILESFHGYSKGNQIQGSIPDKNTVGRNGCIGISDNYPTTSLSLINDIQYNRCKNGEYCLCLPVPIGYYNGYSYVGVNYNKICSDKTDTWMGLYGSLGDLLSYAPSLSSCLYDENYIRCSIPYTHRRHFRLIVNSSIECTILVTKNYNNYKTFQTSKIGYNLPYLDTSWDDDVIKDDCYRVHIANSDGEVHGIASLTSWQ